MSRLLPPLPVSYDDYAQLSPDQNHSPQDQTGNFHQLLLGAPAAVCPPPALVEERRGVKRSIVQGPILETESSEDGRNRDGVVKACSKGHWRPAEDAKLEHLVAQFGPHNWNLIARKLQGRSGKSCRLRWFNQLDPKINKTGFSDEEEGRLLAAQATLGNKWAVIAQLFPGRTDNAVKNHWHVIMARRQREQSRHYYKQQSSDTNIHQLERSINLASSNGGSGGGGLAYSDDVSRSTIVDDHNPSATASVDLSRSATSVAATFMPRSFAMFAKQHCFLGRGSDQCAAAGTSNHIVADTNSEASAAAAASRNVRACRLVCGGSESAQNQNNKGFSKSVHYFDFLGLGPAAWTEPYTSFGVSACYKLVDYLNL